MVSLHETAAVPEDLRDLLPHFTVQLWGELERRTAAIVLDAMVANLQNGSPESHPFSKSWMNERMWAHWIVSRIYRRQLLDALALISFSDAMIRANPKPAAAAKVTIDDIFARRAAGLTMKFRNMRHA